MGQEEELKEKMSTACAILKWELASMWGHVSVRTPDRERFLLMPLRPSLDRTISSTDILEYDLTGNMVSGRREPIDEVFFYTCPYNAREDVGAVIHCHPEMTVALAAVRRKIQAIHTASVRFAGGVPVTPFLYGFWQSHGKKAMEAMRDKCAVIIRGHGVIVTGKNLEEACINTVQLERTAKMILLGSTIGKVEALSSASIKQFRSVVGSRVKDVADRDLMASVLEWRYYESMVKAGERWARL